MRPFCSNLGKMITIALLLFMALPGCKTLSSQNAKGSQSAKAATGAPQLISFWNKPAGAQKLPVEAAQSSSSASPNAQPAVSRGRLAIRQASLRPAYRAPCGSG